MANYSGWTDTKNHRPNASAEAGDAIEQDLALGQLIYDLRTQAGLSHRELAQRIGPTQSVISRLEEGGPARSAGCGRVPATTDADEHLTRGKRQPGV